MVDTLFSALFIDHLLQKKYINGLPSSKFFVFYKHRMRHCLLQSPTPLPNTGAPARTVVISVAELYAAPATW